MRRLFKKAWCQRVERLWILALSEVITLQGAGELRLVDQNLVACHRLHGFEIVGHRYGHQKSKGGMALEFTRIASHDLRGFASKNKPIGRVHAGEPFLLQPRA